MEGRFLSGFWPMPFHGFKNFNCAAIRLRYIGVIMKKHDYFSLIKIAGFLLAAVFLVCSCSAKAQGASPADMEKAFADAGLRLLKERVSSRDFQVTLASQGAAGEIESLSALKGKIVFLNFWATWCGPCRAEMPSMESLYSRYKDKDFEILAVNAMESEAEVIAFMKENGFSFPVALDVDYKIGSAYGIQAIPTTFILDRDGKIAVRFVGSIDWDTKELHAALDALLNS